MANQQVITARAILRDVRITPQKARRVIDLIRGQKADEALTILKFAPQAAGEVFHKLLASAVANAKQQDPAIRDASELYVSEAFVNDGVTLKRFRPRAQGRAYRIDNHITIVVSEVAHGAEGSAK